MIVTIYNQKRQIFGSSQLSLPGFKPVRLFSSKSKDGLFGQAIIPHPFLYKRKLGGKLIPKGKKGIHIKKENKGKFTEYCGGKVTNECIQKGKNSPDPKIRKRATFAGNVRKWNKKK